MKIRKRLERAVRHPEIIRRKAGIVLVRPFTQRGEDEIQFLDEDWDVLIVLDACRHDLFEQLNPFDVPVNKVHSNASHTREYIKNNFVGRDCRDTVYVTASPQFADFDLEFAHIEHVWEDHWDKEARTVQPKSVTDVAINIAEEYSDKRVIVHYMQPHYPFIGPAGQRLTDQATFAIHQDNLSVWEQLFTSRVDEATVREAYEENLSLALPEVERLVENVKGKSVITSDHGNLFGRQVCWLPIRVHGHPPRIHHPELTAVPWVELPFNNRRTVSSADTGTDSHSLDGSVEERLEDLGYVQ